MDDAFALLVTATVRVTGIFAAAWLVTLLLRRKSAAARHMVWTCAIAAAVLMPLLLPFSWQVPLPEALAPWAPSLRERPGFAPIAPAAVPVLDLPGAVAPAPAVGRQQAAAATSVVTPAAVAMTIWATGSGLVLLWILNGIIATARLRRSGTRATAVWTVTARAIVAEMHIGRVTFLESAASTMPFVCGVFNPLVVMPLDASAWRPDRLRAVLLHELGHVRRRDCLTQLASRVACAIYWFHPLAWFAAHRLRVERERACDDLVLTSGVRGSAYGRLLVDIARSTVSRPSGFAADGVAMAHRRRLEERLVSILDPHVLRTSSVSSRLAVTAFGLLAIGAASLQLQAQAPAAPPAPASAPISAPAPPAQTEVQPAQVANRGPFQTQMQPPAQGLGQAAVQPPVQAAAQPAAAQAPAAASGAFEVVSIKRNKEVEAARLAINPNIPTVPGRAQTRPGGVLMGRGMTVRELIRDAYGYRNRAHGDIVGGPGWLDTERYDVQARASGELGASTSMGLPAAAEAAMRAMLAERMKLKIRRESPVRPVYEMVVHRADGRLGPNLKPSKGGCIPFFQREAYNAGLVIDQPKEGEPPLQRPCPLTIRPGLMGAENMTMEEWTRLLALTPQLNRTVVDRTGLTGGYDIMLGDPAAPPPDPRELLPAIKPALERMLGLTLREAEAPVEVLVIESVERPTEN